jgi:hypothetical protein
MQPGAYCVKVIDRGKILIFCYKKNLDAFPVSLLHYLSSSGQIRNYLRVTLTIYKGENLNHKKLNFDNKQ